MCIYIQCHLGILWISLFRNRQNFLKQKYSTAKRFGLEGGESLIPAMEMLIERASEDGVEYIVIGMPHRGRYVEVDVSLILLLAFFSLAGV